jgi:hypothetical protein
VTDTVGPFDGTPWAEAQWYRHAPMWAPSGVYGTPATSSTTGDLPLSVSGRSVGLGAGRANVRGAGFERSGAAVLQDPGANTHASFSRRDRIVLRRNLATHTVTQVVIQGTPSGTPAAPAVTQSETGSWDLPLFSFLVPPASGASISGIIDERTWVGVQPLDQIPIIGKAWRSTGFSSSLSATTPVTVDLTDGRVSGGITFDAANNYFIVNDDGLYDCGGRVYASGSSGYVVTGRIVRQRASVADKAIATGRPGRKIDSLDETVDLFGFAIPLKAGDKILLQQEHSISAGTYYGIDEVSGVYLSVRYVGPLSGATPV